jgi:hypothetical protein
MFSMWSGIDREIFAGHPLDTAKDRHLPNLPYLNPSMPFHNDPFINISGGPFNDAASTHSTIATSIQPIDPESGSISTCTYF